MDMYTYGETRMKKLEIPKTFTLGGSEYSVEFVHDTPLRENPVAQINLPTGKVYISTVYKGNKCSSDYMEASFYHELIHGILDTLGKHELSDDEGLVEGMANLLHQYNKTKK